MSLSRLEFLRNEIRRHDRLYYVEARPAIGDADYDTLYRELEDLERAHPDWITPDSPTQRVGGAPLSAFKQVRHDPPMMSLDKTHSRDDLIDFDTFLRRQLPDEVWDYVVEPKVDGVAFSLLYQKGILTRAATRGNGEVGDDITANIKTIRSVPLSIADAGDILEVRGEVYMTRAGFAELNRREEEAGREPFMNPRNAAAGSLKQLDPREVARRPLEAVIYAAGVVKGVDFPTHGGMLKQFADWGFRTPPWQRLCVDIHAVLAAIDELETMRHGFPFEIDGAVVKVNRRDLYPKLGSTAKSPRWARAFKYEPERAETRIWKITVQVGRTGVLTPVAELDPVLLAGSEISRATLHNADEIARKDIRVGDRVWVVKAGDVIPAIESVLTEKRGGGETVFAMPDTCPECGGAVARIADEVAHRCTNPACPAQRVGRLEHFASRDALDIRAIGGKVAEALVAQEWVKDPLDLFSLTLPQLEAFRIGDETTGTRKFGKNAQTAIEALEAARTRTLDRWLFATGIPNIGVTVADQIAAAHTRFSELADSPILTAVVKLNNLYDQATSANPRSTLFRPKDDAEREERQARYNRICGEIGVAGDFLVAAGVAEKTPNTTLPPLYSCVIKTEAAKSVLAFFAADYGKRYLERLCALGIDPKAKDKQTVAANAPLAGMTFVLTGILSLPRSEIAERIKTAGGIVQDAVSTTTRYLVTGRDAGATKINKARKLGTRVLDEDELLVFLSGNAPVLPTTPPTAPLSPSPISEPYQQQELF
ncbi:MAG TPA: NAD-dependent DNA ligase LigA [Kiritimatiellia bacterium]|nr:NAD-dependent DNA ligase LigA [Kiritimatiellia bacterium]HPS09202.1 NAD-dependent DNA ligase LigA [Kiritimatiellia bacterium]